MHKQVYMHIFESSIYSGFKVIWSKFKHVIWTHTYLKKAIIMTTQAF